jgi:hypothetical protein
MNASTIKQSIRSASEARVKKTLSTATPRKLKIITIYVIGASILALFMPFYSAIVVFFGIVESIRLSQPQLYPFPYDARLFRLLRIGTACYLVIGLVGIVLYWDDWVRFAGPLNDWINS